MKIYVNGEMVDAKPPAKISDVIAGHPHQPGNLVAVIRPTEAIRKETDQFELVTPKGVLGLRLNGSKYADLFRELVGEIRGKGIRWQTSKVTAIGSFPTQIEVSKEKVEYRRHECFFALGGFDSKSSYIMIARTAHQGTYGTSGAVFGRITKGRHILSELREGESILDIIPVVEETAERNSLVTDDLDRELEEGMSVETYVCVKLEPSSPVNCEHLLVISEKGTLPITETTQSYSACSQNLDVSLVAEASGIREPGMVTVRHEGAGQGRIYFYKTRRQVSSFHSRVGSVTKGLELIKLAPSGSKVTLVTDPKRVMVIGMTQADGEKALSGFGLRQRRAGDTADDAIIVEQEPELTMEALHEPEVETLGVRPERINDMVIDEGNAPHSARYLRKMSGLSHKPIGAIKVHFTFEDMPMVTFDGNYSEAGHLVPENEFKEMAMRGDVGVTNMSRPNRGLIGVRLEASDEFGPTGEERYGTNMVGKVTSSLEALMRELKEGDIVYVREVQEKKVPSKRPSKRPRKAEEGKSPPKARTNASAARAKRKKEEEKVG